MLEVTGGGGGAVSSRLLCALLLLLLHGVDRSQQIVCFKALSPPLLEPLDLVECELGITSCHEYAYAYRSSQHLMYAAGCGARVPDFGPSASTSLTVRRVKNCHDVDACNKELRQDLMIGSRVCRYALASRSVNNLTVACLPYEYRCYFEKSASAVPFYNAGCGACPYHTLTCHTCSMNMCNATEASADAAEASNRQTTVASAALTTQATPATSAMALLGAAVVNCLARRLPIG